MKHTHFGASRSPLTKIIVGLHKPILLIPFLARRLSSTLLQFQARLEASEQKIAEGGRDRTRNLKSQLQIVKEELAKVQEDTEKQQAKVQEDTAKQQAKRQEELAKQEEKNSSLELDYQALKKEFEEERAKRMKDVQSLKEGQIALQQKVDEKNNLYDTVRVLSATLNDLEQLRPVALRKFCEFARWKIHRYLVAKGCTEGWMDRGWNFNGWNRMVAGLGQSEYWQEVLSAQGLPMDALQLLRYGPGSLQSQGSEAAHAGVDNDANLDIEMALGNVKAYARAERLIWNCWLKI
ncbi:hypothetical protein GOP47_0021105, partial [Adiantum capillus-veneris]